MFLKLKGDGNIKGRAVAGEKKQREFIIKEEASAPTVATEAVLLSCVIDTQEHQDVSKIDITNALIQARFDKIEDMATIIVRGAIFDVMVDIAPDIYGTYVSTDKKGLKNMILRCHNAIYRTMVASLIYYRKSCKTIKHLGFNVKPYDPCAPSRKINYNQQIVCWL